MTETSVSLLPFYCPLPSVLHPQVELVQDRALRWLADHDLHPHLAGTNSAEFYARITPEADIDRLQPAVHWCYWGFAFDDARCDSGPTSTRTDAFKDLAARLMTTLENPAVSHPVTEDPYVVTLGRIGADLSAIASPVQMRRWINGHAGWLSATAWQVSYVEAGTEPDLNDYLTMRLNSCAGEPTTAMIEIVNNQEVPAAELDSPGVRATTEAARMVAALDNDLVSGQKERRLNQTGTTLVDVIHRQDRCSRQDAIVSATALRDRVMALFLLLSEKYRGSGGPALASYVDGLGHTIRGNIEWSLTVPRYGGQPEFAGWAAKPSDPSREPIPVPSISWWWEQL
ncbi:terpene synthase family protein [Fodinicola feengrottensis]|uniref:Terpene synthase n=1 Tax=Fodinicola feengrottensis TaxID=435914 RepID=A0ABN2J0N1_9ACTN|nr:terpene synthase family protein [Fodinicola feengrottensis]